MKYSLETSRSTNINQYIISSSFFSTLRHFQCVTFFLTNGLKTQKANV